MGDRTKYNEIFNKQFPKICQKMEGKKENNKSATRKRRDIGDAPENRKRCFTPRDFVQRAMGTMVSINSNSDNNETESDMGAYVSNNVDDHLAQLD